MTFFRKKPGHVLMPGRALCGEVVVTEIGTPESVPETIAPDTFENAPSLWFSNLPRPNDGGNKYAWGHALIWGGYPMTGAGLTTIAVGRVALPDYAAALTKRRAGRRLFRRLARPFPARRRLPSTGSRNPPQRRRRARRHLVKAVEPGPGSILVHTDEDRSRRPR